MAQPEQMMTSLQKCRQDLAIAERLMLDNQVVALQTLFGGDLGDNLDFLYNEVDALNPDTDNSTLLP